MSDTKSSTPRPKTPHTPESLAALAKELQDFASSLSALGGAMQAHGFESLSISHHDQRRRGFEYIENFVNAVRATIREAREERGDFKAPEPVAKKPRK